MSNTTCTILIDERTFTLEERRTIAIGSINAVSEMGGRYDDFHYWNALLTGLGLSPII